MRLINLTPRSLNISQRSGHVTVFDISGPPARLMTGTIPLPDIGDFSLIRSEMGGVIDLPPPQADTLYIVSALVAEACPKRTDLICPGPLVRDSSGRVIGEDGFSAGPGLARKLTHGGNYSTSVNSGDCVPTPPVGDFAISTQSGNN